jgi:FkbM family methyltransferase
MPRRIVLALLRRAFRASIRAQIASGPVLESPGAAWLAGYGLRMAFPNRRIWAYQMLDIFDRDCYRAHLLRAGAAVLDAGANVGSFSLYVRWRIPDARITAVEPDPENLSYLRRNLAQLPAPTVNIRPVAIGRGAGRAALSGERSDGRRTVPAVSGAPDVEVLPLAALLQEPLDLLKLDIEGDELAALEGAGDGIRHVRRLAMEYHEYGQRSSALPELLSLLRGGGFDRFAIHSHRGLGGRADPVSYCCLVEAWRHEQD